MTDEEYRRRYAAWTQKGAEAYMATRTNLLTLFGGAKGGSKTVTGCRIIQTDISNYRDGLFVVMRRNYTNLHDTTKKSFDRFFPPDLILPGGKTTNIWRCVNNNEILWWAADSTTDPDYEKTRGLEATVIFPDEASQFDEEFYKILPSLLRRPAYHLDTGEELHRYAYLTSNPVPGNNWLKRHFVDEKTRKRDGRHTFIRSLPDDNPLLPEGYLDDAFSNMTGAMLQMLRFGEWDIEESEFKIVPTVQLEAIAMRRVHDRTPCAAGIDIGLGRPDRTEVWCCNDAGEFWRELVLTEYDTTVQVETLTPIIQRVKDNRGRVCIDAASVGKGISDTLAKMFPATVIPVQFGATAEDEPLTKGKQPQQYENRRAQLYYWERLDVEAAAKQAAAGEDPSIRVELTEELTEDFDNTYFIPDTASGKIKLEPKKVIAERLGRSPDDADAKVLCNAARRKARVATMPLPVAPLRNHTPRRTKLNLRGFR